ncbi:MAG TPA: hypothetical protein VN843_19880 [Anaerolineales bacterium]|nr:hypothetical protein [Anaerolineales bacterium]
MKEYSFNFSITDFLAYLFPGSLMILAVAAFLRITPFKEVVYQLPLNIVTGLLLVALAYFVGIAVSSVTGSLEKSIDRVFGSRDPVDQIQAIGIEGQVKEAFDELFGNLGEWSANHFYISRLFIMEHMTNCARVIERYGSLRQMRRNSILPVMVWGLLGVGCGLKIILEHSYQPTYVWGIGLVGFSILGSVVLIRNLVKVGMYKNRAREIREVCCCLLVYYYRQKAAAANSSPLCGDDGSLVKGTPHRSISTGGK